MLSAAAVLLAFAFSFCASAVGVVNPFLDVEEDSPCAAAILWAVRNGIADGTGEHEFSPDMGCSRALAITFLWRAYGTPAPEKTESSFPDVDPNAYYYPALLWAEEKWITIGTAGASFRPDDICTAGQLYTFLWRAHGKPETDCPEDDSPDGAYCREAAAWAESKGLIDGEFDRNAEVSRAELLKDFYILSGSPEVGDILISEEKAYERLMELKETYYEGMPWTNANKYVWKLPKRTRTAWGCMGFAFIAQDRLYGCREPNVYYNLKEVHVGDVLRLNISRSGHSVVVLEVGENGVKVAEGNYGSAIHWGREISYASLKATLIYRESLY